MLPGAQVSVPSVGIPFPPIPEPRRARTYDQVCPELELVGAQRVSVNT